MIETVTEIKSDKPDKINKNKKLTGPALIGLSILALFLVTFLWLVPNWGSISHVFSSSEAFHAWIESLGLWGLIIYTLIQTAQVIVAPIPGNVTGVAGGALFGVWLGFFLSAIGIVVGSILAFLLGRFLGRRLLIKFAGEANYLKYSKIFNSNASWTLLIIFLVPIFPDDLLCILAGASPLTLRRFIALVLIGRLPGVFVTNLVGAGLLTLPNLVIPWWVWLVVALCVAGLVYLYWSNKEKIGKWLEAKLHLEDEPPSLPAVKS